VSSSLLDVGHVTTAAVPGLEIRLARGAADPTADQPLAG
jgi:hypothetical protein